MVTDQNHSSDSAHNEQEVIRRTEKIAKLLVTDMHSALSGENGVLKKRLEDYHSQYNTLERRVKILERDVKALDDCADTDTVVDLIHEIVPSLIGKKYKGEVNLAIVDFYESSSSESSEESDSGEIIEVRDKKGYPS
jgi:cell division protein FtsB